MVVTSMQLDNGIGAMLALRWKEAPLLPGEYLNITQEVCALILIHRLHRPAYEVSFTIKNTGHVSGAETPQLYVNFPQSSGEPPSVLRGFDSITINPGQSKKVTLSLSRYDLSIWDVNAQGWRRPKGAIGVTVGASSRDGKLKGTLPGSV